MQTRPAALFHPETYDASTPQLITARTAFENAVRGRELAGNEVIMDAWCRTGRLAKLLGAKVPQGRVLGFDDSADMIAFASQECPANVSFAVRDLSGDISDIKERADFLISSWVTPFIAPHRQKAYVSNLLTLLKPEGRLLVLFPEPGSTLSATIREVADRPLWRKYFQDEIAQRVTYSPDEYADLLNACGFSQNNTEEKRMRIVFKTREELHSFIVTSVSRYLPALMHDEPLSAEFTADVAAAYLSRVRCTGASVPYEITMLTATARRPALVQALQRAGGSPLAARTEDYAAPDLNESPRYNK